MNIVASHRVAGPVEMYKDAYVVEITTFWENDDFYSRDKIEIGPFQKGLHEENLYSLIETCKRMDDLHPRVLKHEADYFNVLGYIMWFEPTIWDSHNVDTFLKDNPTIAKKYSADVIRDLFDKAEDFAQPYPWVVKFDSPLSETKYATPPAIENYSIFYFDATGQKFDVEVDWSE